MWANRGLSYVIYLVLYYLLGYRKKVVINNLSQSFPNKSKEEIKAIAKAFYKHLASMFGESLKNFSITEKDARKRLTIKNIEVIDKYADKGQSIISIGGHYGNWELFAITVPLLAKHKHAALYHPIKSKFFDRIMRSTRSKFGIEMITSRRLHELLSEKQEKPISVVFAADQWTPNPKKSHWTPFLNRETPFFMGAEKMARKYNLPVVYGEIIKIKPSHYEVTYYDLTDDPSKLKEGEIMDRYAQLLEKTIHTHNPAHWLWSHKRWKMTKEEVFGKD